MRAGIVRGLLASSLLVVLPSCASGLKLTPIKSTQTRPSNVAAYFKVQTSGGEPIGGLGAEQFKIYEDGQLVSEFESKQVILNPEVAASHYTLLLVDMSGSVSESGSADTVIDAAATFAERVGKTQRVAVYAFDGCERLHPLAPFASPGGASAALRSLKGYKADDPSTNLNGAVVKAIAELDGALAHAEHPIRVGTLVVFSDGTDRAARVSREDMGKALEQSKHDVFAIGLGAEMKEPQLKQIGKTGTAKAEDKATVVKAFDDIAAKIEASTKSYYLLSYCSPARAGKHKLRIEAQTKEASSSSARSGSFESDFDAAGFAPGCDPKQPPSFDVTKGDALAPKEERPQEAKPEKQEARPRPKDDKKDAEKKDDKKDAEKRHWKNPVTPATAPPSPPPAKTESKPAEGPEDFKP